MSASTPFIALHVGAGRHAVSNEKELKKLCKLACQTGMALLKEGLPSREAAVRACNVLESSRLTNAGYGSQLNLDGEVECDASIMESSRGLGASVGCVMGHAHPSTIAGKMLEDLLDDKPDLIGRVRPVMLVGRGAEKYAEQKGLQKEQQDLISDRALMSFLKWKKRYKQLSLGTDLPPLDDDDDNGVQDTVGVICGDSNGVVSVVSSSGGVTLKTPGRIGPAGMLNLGLNVFSDQNSVRAVCLSGTGEDIILSQVGLNLCETLFSGQDCVKKVVAEINAKCALQHKPFYFGALGVCSSADGLLDLVYAHTTEAFIVAHQLGPDPAHLRVAVSRAAQAGAVTLGGMARRAKH